MAVPFSRVSTRLNDCIGIPYPHSEWMDLSPFLILVPPVVRGQFRFGVAWAVFLFPKMASHDVVLGNKLPNSQLPIGSHDVTKV